jgi:hypothetical protein
MQAITEDQALAACGKASSFLLQPDDLAELLFRIEKGRFPAEMRGCDCEGVVSAYAGLSREKRISTAAAVKVMDALEKKGVCEYVRMSWQKWCVIHSFAPWCLVEDGRFGVGLCYYGRFGDAPSSEKQIRSFVRL